MSASPKAAIEMLVRGVAQESGPFGIRANCVGPGWFDADLGSAAMAEQLDEGDSAELRAVPLVHLESVSDAPHVSVLARG